MSDLISRQAAIDALCKAGCGSGYCGVSCDDVKAIEQLPSAQPERKKGKWIAVDDYFNRISGRCSACGWEAHMYEDDVVGMNYCPNCGADMRGEK